MMYLPMARKGYAGYTNVHARTTASSNVGSVVVRKVVAPRFVVDVDLAYVDPGDALVLGFVSNGEVRPSYGRASSLITSGFMAMNDMSRVTGFEITPDYRSMSVRVDKNALGLTSAQSAALAKSIVPYNQGTPLVMCAIATQLLKLAVPLEPVAAGIVSQSLTDLATAFANESLGKLTPPETVRRNVVVEAKRHIEAHLMEASLSPATVAEAMSVSLRSLHLAFENEEASVARTILVRRLERCRQALEDPLHRHFTIDAIASTWGFVNPSHFSRAFRAAFGCSPREWRMRSMELQTLSTVRVR